MRFFNYINEEDAAGPDEETAAIEKIVDTVKMATDKNAMNSGVEQAGAFYKLYGDKWLDKLEKALRVDIVKDIVDRFIEYTKNFSDKLEHLK